MSTKVVALVLLSLVAASLAAPLDDYVNAPDSSYKWEYVNSIAGNGYTTYNINLTSQTWVPPGGASFSVWTHWLQICVPDNIPSGNLLGVMYIDSGSNLATGGLGSAPTSQDYFGGQLCSASGTVVANIGQVPNQPITFFSDPTNTSRSEDALVAYTWVQYMKNTSNPNVIALLPMTKAVVRGMDAVQAFMKTKRVNVKDFVVSGASKRGWAAWTTAAVDRRVAAIAPIVMPMGNMTPLIDAMYRVYGGWSFALNDYINAGVLTYLRTPQWDSLLSIIDPKSYYSRYSGLPKYVIASTGDEFFLPDSVRWWWKDLPTPKMLRVTPNADHSFIEYTPGVSYGIATWVQRLQRDMTSPKFSWTVTYSNTTATIRAVATGLYRPTTVNLYWANTLSPVTRDYRFLACQTSVACINPVMWTQERLTSLLGQNEWTVSMPAPAYGWTAFLIEAVYPGNYIDRHHDNPDKWIRLTTEVNIVPDRFPFGYCEDVGACGPSS